MPDKPNILERLITAAYSLGGTEATESDIARSKATLDKAHRDLARGRVDIPVEGGQPRLALDIRKLSPQLIEGSGYADGGPAVPELGQVTFKSWRRPGTYHHIHRHRDFWTMHRDLHPSVGQVARGQASSPAPDMGIRHAVGEGGPGLVRFVGSAASGSGPITRGLKPGFSLFRALGLDQAPRSRPEFLTQVSDYGTGFVDEARSDAAKTLAGTGAAAALLLLRRRLGWRK